MVQDVSLLGYTISGIVALAIGAILAFAAWKGKPIQFGKYKWIAGIAGIALVASSLGYFSFSSLSVGGAAPAAITGGAVAGGAALECSGVSSVDLLYNDQNRFAAGTDPATNLSVYSPIKKIVADDATATTVPIRSAITALAGQASQGVPTSGYFAEEVQTTTGCVDQDFQPSLSATGTPTLTIVNDNGATVNGASNQETVGTSTTYHPCVTIRAASDACAMKYGGVVLASYSSTYINTVTSALGDYTGAYNIRSKSTGSNASTTANIMDAFYVPGELCDGAKKEVCFDVKSTSTSGTAGQQDVVFEFVGLQKDLNSDDLSTVITGIYDNDNNFIGVSNNTAIYYTT